MTQKINRRQFVILGSTVAASFAATLPEFGAPVLEDAFVAVGYIPTAIMRGASGVSRPNFIDAAEVLSSDPTLLRNGARFRVHGFKRAAAAREAERVTLEALFSLDATWQRKKIPFYAWTAIASGSRHMVGNPVSFVVPVESNGTVNLVLERQTMGASPIAERMAIPFAVNGRPPAFRLTTGTYALAILRKGDPAPEWRSIRIDPGSADSLVHDMLFEPEPVRFDYLLITVSNADAARLASDARPSSGEGEESKLGK